MIVFTLLLLLACFLWTEASRCVGSKMIEREAYEEKRKLFTIAGMFHLQNNAPEETMNNVLVATEAMKFSIQEANERIGRRIIVYQIYDTCGSESEKPTTGAVIDLLIDHGALYKPGEKCLCVTNNHLLLRTLGVVGPADSSGSLLVHRLIGYEKIPIVSYGATSVELSDKQTYPEFYRTIPADNFQAKFISDLLRFYDWKYVALIVGDNNYGRTGAESLSQQFYPDICVSVTRTLSVTFDEREYTQVVEILLSSKKSKVVVVWGWFRIVKHLLELAHKMQLYDRIWVLSDAVSLDPWFVEFQKTFRGDLLFVNPFSGRNSKFEEYFMNLKNNESSNDPWLQNMFQKHNASDENTKIKDLKGLKLDFNLAGFVQNAVNVLIEAFIRHHHRKAPCPMSFCPAMNIRNRTEFNEILSSVSVEGLRGETFTFDKNHNPVGAAYKLHAINSTCFYEVIHWSSTEGFYYSRNDTVFSNATSLCSLPCPPGQTAVVNANRRCCWQCVQCPKHNVKPDFGQHSCTVCDTQNLAHPNVNQTRCIKLKRKYWHFGDSDNLTNIIVALASSLFGILTAMLVIVTFVMKRETPIVKSSNMKMSLYQLLAHVIVFTYPWFMLGREAVWKCYLQTYVIGSIVVIIITITLVKVTRLVAIFSSLRLVTKKEQLQQNMIEVTIFLGIILTYVAIMVVVEISSPIEISEDKDFLMHCIRNTCTVKNYLITHITCVIILLVVCAVQSFKGRKLPWKYNEAKYVGFAMFSSTLVTLVSIPLAISISDPDQYKLMLCLVAVISNYLLMVILFGYKVFIIWFRPQENSVQEFRKESMASMLTSHSQLGRLSCASEMTRYSIASDITRNSSSKSLQSLRLSLKRSSGITNEAFESDTTRRNSADEQSKRTLRRKMGIRNGGFELNELQRTSRILSSVEEAGEDQVENHQTSTWVATLYTDN